MIVEWCGEGVFMSDLIVWDYVELDFKNLVEVLFQWCEMCDVDCYC